MLIFIIRRALLALNLLMSTLDYLLPVLISGSIIVSVMLGLPTEGPLLSQALLAEDLFLSAMIVMMLGSLTLIGNRNADIRRILGYPRPAD